MNVKEIKNLKTDDDGAKASTKIPQKAFRPDPVPFQCVTLTTKGGRKNVMAYAERKDDGITWITLPNHEVISKDDVDSFELLNVYVYTDSRKVKLTEDSIMPNDYELFENDEQPLTINFDWTLWLDVDAYFGVTTRKYDDVFLNFYTNWNPYDGLDAYFVLSSDTGYLEQKWELTKDEKELILKKMNENVLKSTGFSLYEFCSFEDSQTI